jgi:hypothetical protein
MIAFGKVKTPYFSNNPVSEERIPKIADWIVPTLSAEEAGKMVAKHALGRGRLKIRPVVMLFLVEMTRLFPWISRWLIGKTGHQSYAK